MKFISAAILSLSLLFCLDSRAQFPTDRFNNETVVYYGINFSTVKMSGKHDFPNPDYIVNTLFSSWNSFIYREPEKYNLKLYMDKPDMTYNIDFVGEINSKFNPDSLVLEKIRGEVSMDVYEEAISNYNFPDSSGLALMLFAVKFEKESWDFTPKGTYVFTVIDLKTKSLLFAKKYSKMAKGFGLKNYWARSYFEVLKRGIGTDMKHWKKASRK